MISPLFLPQNDETWKESGWPILDAGRDTGLRVPGSCLPHGPCGHVASQAVLAGDTVPVVSCCMGEGRGGFGPMPLSFFFLFWFCFSYSRKFGSIERKARTVPSALAKSPSVLNLSVKGLP